MSEATSGEEPSWRPDLVTLIDATSGDWFAPDSTNAARAGVLSEFHDVDGEPRHVQEGVGIFDPTCWIFHDLLQDFPNGTPDRRLSVATVNDWDGSQDTPEPGMVRFGQPDLYSARNRSTRERDATGRTALPSSQRRIVDAEDGRYALALVAPGPGQVPPGSTSIPAQHDVAVKWPEGVNVFKAGSRVGGVLRMADGISVGGATFFSGQAIAYANQAREAGGGIAEIGAAASAGAAGQPYPGHLKSQERKATPAPPGPDRNPAGSVDPSDRPGGYVTNTGKAHGLLGTLVDPDGAGGHYFVGGEGTPIGPLPLRHDAQFSTGGDTPKVGRLLLSPNEASGLEKGNGKLIKGELWHDASRANIDTELGHETGQWVPVVAVDSASITSGRLPPTSWIQPPPGGPPPQPPGNPPGGPPGGPPGSPPGGGGGGSGSGSGGGKRKPKKGGDGVPGGSGETLYAPGLGGSTQFPLTDSKPQEGPGRSSGGCPVPVGADSPGTSTGTRGGGGTTATGPGTGTGTAGGTNGGTSTAPAGGGSTTSGGNPATTPGGGTLPPVENPTAQARDLTPGTGAPCPNKTGGAGGASEPGATTGGTSGHPAVTTGGGAVTLGGRPGTALGGPDPTFTGTGGALNGNSGGSNGATKSSGGRVPKGEEKKTDAEAQLERWKKRHAEKEAKLEERVRELDEKATNKELAAEFDDDEGRPSQAEYKRNGAKQLRDKKKRAQERLDKEKAKNRKREAYYEQKAERSKNRRGQFANSRGLGFDLIGPDFSRARPVTEGGYTIPVVGQDLQDTPLSIFELGDSQAGNVAGDLGTGTGNWGDHNVANTPLPHFGEEGGPEDLAGWAAWTTLAVRSLQSTVNGAFGGPGYFAGNMALIEEATAGNQPTGSVIGARHVALEGEQITAGNNQAVLQVLSQAGAADGGSLTMSGAGLFEVVRDTQSTAIADTRPAILIENDRGQPGQAKGDMIASHDARFRVNAKARGSVSGLDVHRKPGETDGSPLFSVGRSPMAGQALPCGKPTEEYVSVADSGLVSLGDKVKISKTGNVCISEIDEAPGEPEKEGDVYLYALNDGLYIHPWGDVSPTELGAGSSGGDVDGGTP